MNRSFIRAQESQMQQATMRQGQQLRTSIIKEKDDNELALFLEMRKCQKERNHHHNLQNSKEFDAPIGSKPGNSSIFTIASSAPARRTGADDFLNLDNGKNDYDWLLTPPGTPLFPSLEMESHKTIMSQIGTPKARPTALQSRLANAQPETMTRSNNISKQPASSSGVNSSNAALRRPSSSGGLGSRPSTPTGRPTLNGTSKPSRSSTPTSRPTLSSTKPTAPTRSITPSSRSTVRSSTPTARPSTIPLSKSTPLRASTPTRRTAMPSSVSNSFAAPVKSLSSVSKSVPASIRPTPTPSKNPTPSRGPSPTVKSRPLKPAEMPGYSNDTPPNLRTSAPERPLSASRGRPGAPSPRSSSVEPLPRPRRQSCSPSRGGPPIGVGHMSGRSVPAVRRQSKIVDNVSPIMMGTKMVERVINMRKLVQPKQEAKHSPNMSGKSASSPDSSGFGRNLSKKSLDMAIRHMDIRRSIPGNMRPLMTTIPASSMYSVRSGPPRIRGISASDSPLATSSNASSEVSVNNNGLCVDGSSELDDEINSQRTVRSTASLRGR